MPAVLMVVMRDRERADMRGARWVSGMVAMMACASAVWKAALKACLLADKKDSLLGVDMVAL